MPTCQVCGSVGVGSEMRQWPLPTILSGTKLSTSSYLDSRNFGSFLYATGDFQAAPQCWSSEGVSLSKSMCGFFKGNCMELQKSLPLTQCPMVFAARSCGYLSSWHWNSGLGGLVWGWDSLLPRDSSWIFIHHTWIWDQSGPCLCPYY